MDAREYAGPHGSRNAPKNETPQTQRVEGRSPEQPSPKCCSGEIYGLISDLRMARTCHQEFGTRTEVETNSSADGATVRRGADAGAVPVSPFRGYFNYVPNAYEAGGRTTSLAISPVCVPGNCRLWATPAGGGVWRTDDALKTQPTWTYLSGSFGINAVSSIALDPNDSNTVWVGTGEANASADSEAGVGLYKSTDGGDTWTGRIGKSHFNARAIGTIAIDPTNSNTIYVGTTRAVRGISSVLSGGAVSLAPGASPWGLYKSTDGGTSWTFIFNGAQSTQGCTNNTNVASNLTLCSARGVRRVLLDPSKPNIVYASAYAKGVWRSSDGVNTWSQIFLPIADGPSTSFTERAEIAVTRLAGGNTRMYLVIGQIGAPPAQTYRPPSTITPVHTQPAHRFSEPPAQCWQEPQEKKSTDRPTRSPRWKLATPGPTSSTGPAISCPDTTGNRVKGNAPFCYMRSPCRFRRHEPEATARLARAGGGTLLRRDSRWGSRMQTAFMVATSS
jgi:hypothetical protein